MTVRRAILAVEELGQRILPSLSPLNPVAVDPVVKLGAVHDVMPPVHHALAGHGSGTYTASTLLADTVPPMAPPGQATPMHIIVGDIGTDYHFTGVADLARLGHVSVTGSIMGLGFIASGHATGTLTFTNAHGSVTIALTGPSQPGFSPLPTQFQYTVVGATGAYLHVHDHGTVNLVLHPTATGTIPGIIPGMQGTFTLRMP